MCTAPKEHKTRVKEAVIEDWADREAGRGKAGLLTRREAKSGVKLQVRGKSDSSGAPKMNAPVQKGGESTMIADSETNHEDVRLNLVLHHDDKERLAHLAEKLHMNQGEVVRYGLHFLDLMTEHIDHGHHIAVVEISENGDEKSHLKLDRGLPLAAHLDLLRP